MMEKFGDILQFCSHLSKLMVTEIRRRASNQSTGLDIVTIVNIETAAILNLNTVDSRYLEFDGTMEKFSSQP